MNAFRKHRAYISFPAIVLLLTIAGLQGCVHASYQAADGTKVSVTALSPTGVTTTVEAEADGDKRSLSLNREQGSAEGIARIAADAVSPLPFGN